MTSSVLFQRTTASSFSGRYAYCAKCGDDKDENRHYVHNHCTYPYKIGGFRYCAVCAKQRPEESRDYVCMECIVR